MRKLRRKKAHGTDKLPPNFTIGFHKSLSLGIVTDLWKISKVTQLYKYDSKSDFSNYRPISVLPCLSKVLKQVFHRQLSDYLEIHYLLKSSQFGFRPRRSTELVCNLLADDIRKNVDNGLITGVIYRDLSKAIDTISHSYLLPNLPSYRVNIWELTLTQHWHWMVASVQNTKSSVPDYDSCQNYTQIWM